MIVITNRTKGSNGVCEYTLQINNEKPLATFSHHRGHGLAACLRAAADALQEDTNPFAMKAKYELQLGRDATQMFKGFTDASLEDIKSRVSRHGYDDDKIIWSDSGSNVFDEVEFVHVVDTETQKIVASYNSQQGWEAD